MTADPPTLRTEHSSPAAAPIRQRVRIRFTKQDDLRWISHLDMIRLWERLFRRAGLALSMTEGFHPKPRMNFPSALAVGIAGEDELIEIDLAEEHSGESLRAAITSELPPGMRLGAIEVLASPARKAQATGVSFEMPIPHERQAALEARIAWLLEQKSHVIQREGRDKPLDLRPLIADLKLIEGRLRMHLHVDPQGSARPREVLAALEVNDFEYEGYFLTRTRVEIAG
jgi:radical SAM-linked protein